MACTVACGFVHAADEESGCGGDGEATHTRQYCNLMQLVRLVSDAALTPGFASSLLALKVFCQLHHCSACQENLCCHCSILWLVWLGCITGGFLWKLPTKAFFNTGHFGATHKGSGELPKCLVSPNLCLATSTRNLYCLLYHFCSAVIQLHASSIDGFNTAGTLLCLCILCGFCNNMCRSFSNICFGSIDLFVVSARSLTSLPWPLLLPR